MFHNTDPETNGERAFYERIKDRLQVIFDVGCRYDSCFTEFPGIVHYFEPVPEFLERLKLKSEVNANAYYNAFGLGNDDTTVTYYPKWQSFCDRSKSLREKDGTTLSLRIRKAADYIRENGLEAVDFLKIDTEGYELEVLKGFGETLRMVKVIQFEYGGTYIDSGVRLVDVVDYLHTMGFDRCFYLSPDGTVPVTDFTDHYYYCNIIAVQPSFVLCDKPHDE
jgi:FkbM family methyltransferase